MGMQPSPAASLLSGTSGYPEDSPCKKGRRKVLPSPALQSLVHIHVQFTYTTQRGILPHIQHVLLSLDPVCACKATALHANVCLTPLASQQHAILTDSQWSSGLGSVSPLSGTALLPCLARTPSTGCSYHPGRLSPRSVRRWHRSRSTCSASNRWKASAPENRQ